MSDERTKTSLDRCWLLTWTTYGTWLPGDARGSIARVREDTRSAAPRTKLNAYEEPYADAIPNLAAASAARMKGTPVLLNHEQAEVVARQIEESARFRSWALLAGSVMANHVHVVIGVPGDPSPSKLLQIVKSYASRTLNERWPRPASETWWTSSGSTRKLPDDEAVHAAVRYVQEQRFILAQCEAVNPEPSPASPRGTTVPRSPGEEGDLRRAQNEKDNVIEEGTLK